MYTDQDYKDMLGEVWNTLEDLGISFSVEYALDVGWHFSASDGFSEWYSCYADLERDVIKYALSRLSSTFMRHTKESFLNPDK